MEVEAITMKRLLEDDKSYADHIDLLKKDMEGAEAVIFSDDCEPWLDKIHNLLLNSTEKTVK